MHYAPILGTGEKATTGPNDPSHPCPLQEAKTQLHHRNSDADQKEETQDRQQVEQHHTSQVYP